MAFIATICLIVIAIALLPQAIENAAPIIVILLYLCLAVIVGLLYLLLYIGLPIATVWLIVMGCVAVYGYIEPVVSTAGPILFSAIFHWKGVATIVGLLAPWYLIRVRLRHVSGRDASWQLTHYGAAASAAIGAFIFLAGVGGTIPRALQLPDVGGRLLFCSLGVLAYLAAWRLLNLPMSDSTPAHSA